jgi:hypothetical protein
VAYYEILSLETLGTAKVTLETKAPKGRFLLELHGVISQKIFTVVTAVKTS